MDPRPFLLLTLLLAGCTAPPTPAATPDIDSDSLPAAQPLAAIRLETSTLQAGTLQGVLQLHNPTSDAFSAYRELSTHPCGWDTVEIRDGSTLAVLPHDWDGLSFDCLAMAVNATQDVPAGGKAAIRFSFGGWHGIEAGRWYLVHVVYRPGGAPAGSAPVSTFGQVSADLWVQA